MTGLGKECERHVIDFDGRRVKAPYVIINMGHISHTQGIGVKILRKPITCFMYGLIFRFLFSRLQANCKLQFGTFLLCTYMLHITLIALNYKPAGLYVPVVFY